MTADPGKAGKARRDHRQRRNELRKDISRIALIVGIFAVMGLFLHDEHVRKHLLDMNEIHRSISPNDTFMERVGELFTFFLVAAPLVMVGMPRIWVSGVAGALFGAVIGVPVALIASVAGACGTYFLGRSMFASTVKRRFGKRLSLWRDRFRANGFQWTLYARLFPFTNATLTSLLCGSCKVGFGSFALASLIGFIPLTVSFAILGSGATKASTLQLLLGAAVLLGSMVVQRFFRPREMSRRTAHPG